MSLLSYMLSQRTYVQLQSSFPTNTKVAAVTAIISGSSSVVNNNGENKQKPLFNAILYCKLHVLTIEVKDFRNNCLKTLSPVTG